MRIGVVSTSYPRDANDFAGGFVAGFARWLARRGHQVEVVAAGEPGGAADDGPGVRIARVRAGARLFYDEGAPERLARSWSARARAPLFAAALSARVLRAARAWDVVVSHWLAPSGLAAAATGRPHLAIAHSGDVHLLARPGLADAAAAMLLGGGPLRVAFAGAHLRERLLGAASAPLRRLLEARSLVSPMGVDTQGLTSLRPEVPGPVHGAPLIAFVGRLVPIKGARVLIEAARRLGRAQVVIAGDGPERGALEAIARDACARTPGLSVRFAGEVRGAARDALYAAADAVALPSVDLASGRTEGTPVVAIEAMAAGVPLCASDVGGVRDACGEAALLVPPGDAAALATALQQVFARPDETGARVRAGRARAAEFDWERVGARLWDAIPQLESSGRVASRARRVLATLGVGPAS